MREKTTSHAKIVADCVRDLSKGTVGVMIFIAACYASNQRVNFISDEKLAHLYGARCQCAHLFVATDISFPMNNQFGLFIVLKGVFAPLNTRWHAREAARFSECVAVALAPT